ncbi:DUF2334 domain-containing protein [Svornostia abyssi]|uniref:DUF2334 domain-containing protein n=1 Tax=Svornostia abyssi TaxID=2898438 RepID=A0ABY5PLW1_9ACTN|nr:DUF2334 domain-containing protein [Parviterribacteraceae bacterium J379]
MTADERRGAALLFGEELARGAVTLADLEQPAVRDAVRAPRVPPWPVRRLERRRYEQRRPGYRDDSREAFHAARRAVLGPAADGPPRVLVRVDEYPNFDTLDTPAHGIAHYWRFHETMRDSGVPYLVAVQPALARNPLDCTGTEGRPLDADELAMLGRLRDDGVAFALHGHDHRTRTTHMPNNTELEGRSAADLGDLLDRGLAFLAAHDVRPRVLVPPYNTFGARQWPVLAQRFAVVTGGPESVQRVGYRRSPLFWDGTVFQPCYAPLYGTAAELLTPARALATSSAAVWTCITLHWAWELADDFAALRDLLTVLAPVARPWDDFLAAVDTAGAHG